MVPLQKLLGKEDRFFDLFEASAEQACHSVQALKKFLQHVGPDASLEDFIASRRKDKAITAEINEALCTSYVTAMEPEDIEALSSCIYKVPKTCEKIAERILLAPQHLNGVDLTPQVVMLEKATDILLQMVKDLRKGSPRARLASLNQQMQTVEGEADKTTNQLLRGLYNATENPGRVLFLKDIYELLEKVTDRCRDAGNVILQIVLKGS
ncbi:MAG: DUF47 family protein [Verrucomicrobia bacterium]|nr:DUF47 family protein [Verrucomicrobiota bacterium]